jgi:hypothetical protein
MNLVEYLPMFMETVMEQLEQDQLRWGDTWKIRPVEGQDDRMFARFADYKDQFTNANIPVPYQKIVGEALINWVRSTQDYLNE